MCPGYRGSTSSTDRTLYSGYRRSLISTRLRLERRSAPTPPSAASFVWLGARPQQAAAQQHQHRPLRGRRRTARRAAERTAARASTTRHRRHGTLQFFLVSRGPSTTAQTVRAIDLLAILIYSPFKLHVMDVTTTERIGSMKRLNMAIQQTHNNSFRFGFKSFGCVGNDNDDKCVGCICCLNWKYTSQPHVAQSMSPTPTATQNTKLTLSVSRQLMARRPRSSVCRSRRPALK